MGNKVSMLAMVGSLYFRNEQLENNILEPNIIGYMDSHRKKFKWNCDSRPSHQTPHHTTAVEIDLSSWCHTDKWRLSLSVLVLSNCSVEPVAFQICIKVLGKNWQESCKNFYRVAVNLRECHSWRKSWGGGLSSWFQGWARGAGVTMCGHEEVMKWREKTQARVIRREPVRKYLQFRCDRRSLTSDVYKVSIQPNNNQCSDTS